MLNRHLTKTLQDFAHGSGRITILTGAGISAESGIPTFRGPEGYWTIGSKEYQPQEMATYSMFVKKPDEVWKWYLYRIGVCGKASPNSGHLSLVEMETLFKDRFTLITQNVDNLHLRAGSRLKKTFQIHGNVFFMRCAGECALKVYPIPKHLSGRGKNEDLTQKDRNLLMCQDCGSRTRPHVLWFDEMYNEHFYRYHSALDVAGETELLIVVGTSGATNLPNQVVWEVKNRDGVIIDINIEENPFSNLALKSRRGFFLKQPSGKALPSILQVFKNILD
ncbi:MAG: RNA polymerase subunit sigma [Deltaproteobacteria bacterium]|nr:RNA polymerase subunit sigma [Deltaproteobacteria bacterium]MBW1970791.1 RNA polymerase subunit sigma [Deltaproteobacteria bacterium]MBW2157942.1 RNA polymerase subunit sigma [Deltaproteobacteria bacterium]MBW2226792.1 RNA polymerase subunit sigma [Deltaproteobacteria bacterium]MBW2325390.1 RNA polymerase subunit sigma [Deltaproteobacteria bacterium]